MTMKNIFPCILCIFTDKTFFRLEKYIFNIFMINIFLHVLTHKHN